MPTVGDESLEYLQDNEFTYILIYPLIVWLQLQENCFMENREEDSNFRNFQCFVVQSGNRKWKADAADFLAKLQY